MTMQRITGPGSGVEKYDLLTALAVEGLAAGGAVQASMMRLIALVTARYNWATNEVSIGHKDLATLWAVDERTSKRETKRLIDAGFLTLKRRGVRGRVACYQLNASHIYGATRPRWPHVGSDFSARMACRIGLQTPPAAPEPPRPGNPQDQPWATVRQLLAAQHPKLFAAWFDALALHQQSPGQVTLSAPTRFAAQYIATHLLPPLEAAFTAASGHPVRCSLIERPGG